MSVGQLERRIISLLEKYDGFIEAQNVLEGHFAALLKVKSKKKSKSHHLGQVKSLLLKMERQGKIVIGWSGHIMRTATLVKQEVVLPMSELNESKSEEVHVQEVMVLRSEEVDVQPATEPEVSADQTVEMPKHELLTLTLLEARKVAGDGGSVKGPIVSLVQTGLGCPQKTAERLVAELRRLGLIEKITGGRRPVYRVDTEVSEVTPEMCAAKASSMPTKARVSPRSKPQPRAKGAKAKAEATPTKVEDVAMSLKAGIPAAKRIEKLLENAAAEIKRLRVRDEKREQELEALRAENRRLQADIDAIGATGDRLEEMLRLDLVH